MDDSYILTFFPKMCQELIGFNFSHFFGMSLSVKKINGLIHEV